jgi:predicted acylesterase/phospholipase RssA/proteasome lid subunit RPN8/RPN11
MGIGLRAREEFELVVGPDFPYTPPSVWVPHRRWAGTPHVHWGRLLCLYLAPAVEWNPADGMFGLVDRLGEWLASAAADELDPAAAPLHPPVTYTVDPTMPQIVVRASAPVAAGDVFLGVAVLDRGAVREGRADVVAFKPIGEVFAEGWPEHFSLTLIMPGEFDWEYPSDVAALIRLLENRGLDRALLLDILELGARKVGDGRPLIVLLGTPMRRIEGQRLIHFVAWGIAAEQAEMLRFRILKESDEQRFREVGERAEEVFNEWAAQASLAWCRLHEDRPEVVRRRDQGSPIGAFAGKTVVVWGCGALGAPIAEAVARVGPRKLILYDKGRVNPGILVRQPYDDSDIGFYKAQVLATRLKNALPALDVEWRSGDLLAGPLAREDWTDVGDVLIDATASIAVGAKLERVRRLAPQEAWVVSAAFGHEATRGLATVSPPRHPGGPYDLARKAKIRLRTKAWPRKRWSGFGDFADEFWPREPRGDTFQPEPGCSEPTFRGSLAEAEALAQTMLLWAGQQIAGDRADSAAFLTALPNLTDAEQREPRRVELAFPTDVVLAEGIQGYEVRLAPSALADLRGYVRKNDRDDPADETGGLLFGERDEAAGIVWVSEVIGPPPDSECSPTEFICGVEGVECYRREKRERGSGSLNFVGTWHTHPGGPAAPSAKDVAGMAGIVLASEPRIPRALLLIVGGSADDPQLAAYMFDRRDLEPPFVLEAAVNEVKVRQRPAPARDVGLAFSGGGFRAVAFHLGCLRALHDRGVLDRVSVVSGVSGGSLAAALFAYGDGDFPAFDAEVCELLHGGLDVRVARRVFLSSRTLKTVATVLTSGLAAVGARLLAFADGVAARLPRVHRERRLILPPLRRFSSATEAMADVFDELFTGKDLSDPRRGGVDVVLNACELRTGSAFRFGSRESHCWRYGTVVGDIPVATAVAASAAYPIMLPALDRELRFRRGEVEESKRVVLTDGGVFDNLGTSVLEPGRDSSITVTYELDYIVACDAGRGLLDDGYIPYAFPSRLRRAFEATFRKAQDGARNRLHLHAASGGIKGFVFPYLGQREHDLPLVPVDLPLRDEVVDYPTDFAAMSDNTIELIAGRGEKLTRLLLDFYCPEL